MGCDIHFYVERRDAGSPTWVTADVWEAEYGTIDVAYGKSFYNDRNYGLFAILADVRNSHGMVPISQPRGVPDDACPEYREVVKDDGDGHSHSWLTLAELLAYDWTQTATYSGVVDPGEWARVRDNPERGPESWSASVGGGRVTMHTPEQFERAWQALRVLRDYPEQRRASQHLINDKADLEAFVTLLGDGSPYTKVEWTVPYYRPAATFFGEVIPRLLRLGAPDDVRCCFFFDN